MLFVSVSNVRDSRPNTSTSAGRGSLVKDPPGTASELWQSRLPHFYQCLSEETLKSVGRFYMACARGTVPTRGRGGGGGVNVQPAVDCTALRKDALLPCEIRRWVAAAIIRRSVE